MEKPMKVAIESALQGVRENEGGPFGACIIKGDKIIAVAHNTVLKEKDPTCHSEINAIRQAAQSLNSHILKGCILYSTVEPCPMCLAAIYWARIDKVYTGVGKGTAAEYGFDDAFFYEQIKLDVLERAIPCETGILANDCKAVFQKWKELGRPLY